MTASLVNRVSGGKRWWLATSTSAISGWRVVRVTGTTSVGDRVAFQVSTISAVTFNYEQQALGGTGPLGIPANSYGWITFDWPLVIESGNTLTPGSFAGFGSDGKVTSAALGLVVLAYVSSTPTRGLIHWEREHGQFGRFRPIALTADLETTDASVTASGNATWSGEGAAGGVTAGNLPISSNYMFSGATGAKGLMLFGRQADGTAFTYIYQMQ